MKKMKQGQQDKHSLKQVTRVRQKKKKHQKEIITAKGSFAANYLNNKLEIENKYASLISLIDTIYPPLICTICDTVSPSRIQSNIHFNEKHKNKKKSRYLCIHPHCDQSFLSRATLRFHISHSHLVHWAKKPLADPVFLNANEQVEEEEDEEVEEDSGEVETAAAVVEQVNSPMAAVTSPIAVAAAAAVNKTPILSPFTMNKSPTPIIQQQLPILTVPTSTQPNHITADNIKTPSLSPPSSTKQQQQQKKATTIINNTKKHKITPSPPPNSNNKKLKLSTLINNDDLTTPSPPPSPFSLYHPKKPTKKPQLSAKAEVFLNTHYPPLQCPACLKIFNRKTNVIKHLTEDHLGQEPYRCIYPKCAHPRLYATREGLIYHILRIHDNDPIVEEQIAAAAPPVSSSRKAAVKK